MTDEKQGAAEWLREKARNLRSAKEFNCKEFMAYEFNASCNGRRCVDCYVDMFERIADRIEPEADELRGLRDENERLRGMVRELQLPEGVEWPRFEDGELVKVGDEVERDGDVMRVDTVWFHRECWSLSVSCPGVDGVFHGEYGAFGEPVKRPTPKVLGADGVPIRVGDMVYFVGGSGQPYTVVKVDANGGEPAVDIVEPNGVVHWSFANTERLTHERPDSWERLEEDAYHLVMSEYLEAPEKDVSGLVRRAKALAKAGE